VYYAGVEGLKVQRDLFPAPSEVRGIEERTAKVVGEPVALTVRARTDVLVTGTRYEAVGDVRSSEDPDGTPTPQPRSP
jgi:hypothetical protein